MRIAGVWPPRSPQRWPEQLHLQHAGIMTRRCDIPAGPPGLAALPNREGIMLISDAAFKSRPSAQRPVVAVTAVLAVVGSACVLPSAKTQRSPPGWWYARVTVHSRGPPGALRDLLGLSVEEFLPLRAVDPRQTRGVYNWGNVLHYVGTPV
jgi:hypothetical protein